MKKSLFFWYYFLDNIYEIIFKFVREVKTVDGPGMNKILNVSIEDYSIPTISIPSIRIVRKEVLDPQTNHLKRYNAF